MKRTARERQNAYLQAIGSQAAASVRAGRPEMAVTMAFQFVSPNVYLTPLEARAADASAPTKYEKRAAARYARTVLTLGQRF